MIASNQVTVGTESTVIIANDVDGQNVTIKNTSDTEVYLGDGNVTISNGFKLEQNEIVDMFLGPGEEIYGIVDDGTGEICYIATMNQ